MAELHLHRQENTLHVTFGEHRTEVSLAALLEAFPSQKNPLPDMASIGQHLFRTLFANDSLGDAVQALKSNERLLLIADDPLVAAIPWEYLRNNHGDLLAGRINLVRGLPENQRRDQPEFANQWQIIAVPAAPIDETRILNTAREYQNLVIAVQKANKQIRLIRVRPPTSNRMEQALNPNRTSIVHFMGHSSNLSGQGVLEFEDDRARKRLIDARNFADGLDPSVFLIILNSCLSAAGGEPTEFGNIAQGLVQCGIPYALGMQFTIPDNAALIFSETLFSFLLGGRDVEEAVRRTRRGLLDSSLAEKEFLVGIPVLYTSLREVAPFISLVDGAPAIEPDPEQLETNYNLTALPEAKHFVGRSQEMSKVLDAVTGNGQDDFVVLLGLGGTGKTALARAVAERVGWRFGDRGLAISFETYATLDEKDNPIINAQFADSFYAALARFYGIDLGDTQYQQCDAEGQPIALQQAVLQRRKYQRSLLILDNVETLLHALDKQAEAAKALGAFIRRLSEGDGVVILTSRILPPADWGRVAKIDIEGLTLEAGAALFVSYLRGNRYLEAGLEARQRLSERVDGHPLSIRLLATRFDELAVSLDEFLTDIEGELQQAEQQTPDSLTDRERQSSLYACLSYSVKRLNPDQQAALQAVGLFQSTFRSDFGAMVIGDESKGLEHLQALSRLSLLDERKLQTGIEGTLAQYELHPVVRWYTRYHLPADAEMKARYGKVYQKLATDAEQGFDQDKVLRNLILENLAEFDSIFDSPSDEYMEEQFFSLLASQMAEIYRHNGQFHKSIRLYERSLEIEQSLGNVPRVAKIQSSIADMLRYKGKIDEAINWYEQSLQVQDRVGFRRGYERFMNTVFDSLELQDGLPMLDLDQVVEILEQQPKLKEAVLQKNRYYRADITQIIVIQLKKADALTQQGNFEDAMSLYEESLKTAQRYGDRYGEAVVKSRIGNSLKQQSKMDEALDLYRQSLQAFDELGDVHGSAITQRAMADVLTQQGQLDGSLDLYRQSLQAFDELGDVRGSAITQRAMADVLTQQGQPDGALHLYRQSLQAFDELGDVYEIAVTQTMFAQFLFVAGKDVEGLKMAWGAYRTFTDQEYLSNAAQLKDLLIQFRAAVVGVDVFEAIWEEAITESMPDWLKSDQLAFVVKNTITAMTSTAEYRDDWQELIQQSLSVASENNEPQGVDFLSAILRLLKGEPTGLLVSNPYQSQWRQILAGIEEAEKRKFISFIMTNTILFMTEIPSRKVEWQRKITAALQYARLNNNKADSEFLEAVMSLLKDKPISLPNDHPYRKDIDTIQAGIAAGGIERVRGDDPPFVQEINKTESLIIAIEKFIEAENWTATQVILEDFRHLLFEVEVEKIFEINIRHAEEKGDFQFAKILQIHLQLLRDAKALGIEVAFEKLNDDIVRELPFDESLIPLTVEALVGDRSIKMTHAEYLVAQLQTTANPQLKELISVIQLALFGTPLNSLGGKLEGVYKHTWQTIVVLVETGGVDPRLFESLIQNTVAVLGPVKEGQSEWRNDLADIRNGAVVEGNTRLVQLIDTIEALFNANGNPAGLGDGLSGVFATTWQAIVKQLNNRST